MVADEVDDHNRGLSIRNPQTSPKLLEKYDVGLSRSQHDDAVDRWNVNALVENIHRAYSIQLTTLEIFKCLFAIIGARAGKYCVHADFASAQPLANKTGVFDAATEQQ